MANPQPDRHTRISNEIIEALAKIRIPGEAMQILWVIFRKTYGWNKKEDRISMGQLSIATNLKRPTVARAINKLVEMNLIIKKDNTYGNLYRFNKDYDSWKPLSKKITLLSKKITPVNKKDNKSVIKKDTYKRKKDTKTKDIYISLFDFFWNRYPFRNGKRLGKQESFEAMKRHVKESEVDDFKKAFHNYCESNEVNRGYAKDPKRFFKNRDWNWRDWIEVEPKTDFDNYKPGEALERWKNEE